MSGNEDEIGLLSGTPTPPAAAKPAAPPPAQATFAAEPAHVPTPKLDSRMLLTPEGRRRRRARFVTADTVTTLSAVLTSRPPRAGPGQHSTWRSPTPRPTRARAPSGPSPGCPRASASLLEIVPAKDPQPGSSPRPASASPFSSRSPPPSGSGTATGWRSVSRAHRAEEGGNAAKLTLACVGRQAVLAIKTSRGYEREVADTLLARAEEKPDVVFALLVPPPCSGGTSSPRG
jgi:hypothetical protein